MVAETTMNQEPNFNKIGSPISNVLKPIIKHNRCHMPACKNRKPFRTDSEMRYAKQILCGSRSNRFRRHLATHTRPFLCKEDRCITKPFGDKAGLLRHLREVHGKRTPGQPAQIFKCPEINCKRHDRGFGREHNMLEHHRRIHAAPFATSSDLKHRDPGSPENRNISGAPWSNPSSVEGRFEDGDATCGELETISPGGLQEERKSNQTALQVLRAELDLLKARREQAVRGFDQEIDAMTTTVRVMEERIQSFPMVI